jgi:hypothetical protein
MSSTHLLEDGRAVCVNCGDDFQTGWQLYNHQQWAGSCHRKWKSVSDGPSDVEFDHEDFVSTPTSPSPSRSGSSDDEELGGLEEPPDFDVEDHECGDGCDCNATDDINYGGDDLLQYVSWGECYVSETGKEILRFLSTVMKGKSMSSNKAEDFLR